MYHLTSVSNPAARVALPPYRLQVVLETHNTTSCFNPSLVSHPPLSLPPPLCRGILPMSSRSVMNHNQQVGGPTGQSVGMVGVGGERGGAGGVGAGRSGSMGSPSRSSPSIIGMPKQQQARQPFTINR